MKDPFLKWSHRIPPLVWDGFLVSALLVLSLALRLSSLPVKFLDIDEAFQLFIAASPDLSHLFSSLAAHAPQQYPLDYFFSFAATRFSTDIVQLRLLPLAWGLAAVAGVYATGCRLAGRAYGWMWGFLLAISILHIQYSETFRPYALIVCLSVWSMYFFLRSLKEPSWAWAYALTTLAYQLAYPFAVCKTFLEAVTAFRSGKKHKWFYSGVFFVTALVPLFLMIFQGRNLFGGQAFQWSFSEVIGFPVLRRVVFEYGQYSTATSIVFGALLSAALVSIRVRPGLRSPVLFALALIGLTAMAIVASLLSVHLFLKARHTLPLLPVLLGLVALAPALLIDALEGRFAPSLTRISVSAGFSLVMFLLSWNMIDQLRTELSRAKGFIDAAVTGVRSGISDGDSIVLNNPNAGATFVYYYDRPSFFGLNGIELFRGFDIFLFPSPLMVTDGVHSNAAYAIFRPNPSLATLDHDQLMALSEKKGKVWLVDIPFNYFAVPYPFEGVVDPKAKVERIVPGVYVLKGNIK